MNIGSNAVNLTGLRLTNAVRFDFNTATITTLDPGQIVLLVRNQTAFQLRYGAGLPVIGKYQGNLANDGENILLLTPAGPVVDVTYQTEAPWPDADGSGFSLEAVSLTGDFNSPSNWVASEEIGGTPGRIPTNELRIDSVRFSEGKVILQFQARAGRTYTLLYVPSLPSTNWTALNTVSASTTNTLRKTEDIVPAGTLQRYYRLALP